MPTKPPADAASALSDAAVQRPPSPTGGMGSKESSPDSSVLPVTVGAAAPLPPAEPLKAAAVAKRKKKKAAAQRAASDKAADDIADLKNGAEGEAKTEPKKDK